MTKAHPTNEQIERVADDVRGVCYRPGKPTVADYNEAITDLLAAKHQLQSGSLMGCGICGSSGHAPQDGLCLHDPLILARQWAAAAAGVWHCWHCGYIASNAEEATAHFGKRECDDPACFSAAITASEGSGRDAMIEECAKVAEVTSNRAPGFVGKLTADAIRSRIGAQGENKTPA